MFGKKTRMTIADVALIGAVVMIAVAVIDSRRGKSGLGKVRLDKEEDPTRFWFAIVLYVNMALGLFWLAGQVPEPEPETQSVEEARLTITNFCEQHPESCTRTLQPEER